MKAVILVGGLGTRLRPLTCNTPKPMMPLVNQPFIEYMLERLRDNGIDEAILAVQYLADRFRTTLGDGSRLGIKAHVVEEPEPRGTAGAVKYVERMLDGPTFVFNGDVMTDLDLRAMLTYHQEQRSKLTIALTPVEDPTAFGLVETTDEGRIRRFLEKPRIDEVTTNMINAGTYILDPALLSYVPMNEFYMFERGLFPTALQHNEPMYAYPSNSYWTDIGKPETYLDVHHDILVGKVQYTFRGRHIAERVWIEDGVHIHPDAHIVGPVVIGADVKIESGARIIGPTVIGPGCVIRAGAVVEGSVLWDGNVVQAGAVLHACVIGHNNQIGEKVHVTEGSVISDDCRISADNRIERGMRVWPETVLNERSITF
jgi:mannose-1-phosphate guanylyltransferase